VNPTEYPLIDSSGVHLPAGLTNYRSPATVLNDQQSVTQEIRLQSNDPSSRLSWTAGVFWQESRELSVEQIYDPMANALTEYRIRGERGGHLHRAIAAERG
jgi:iron complex outermembrane receptor protein